MSITGALDCFSRGLAHIFNRMTDGAGGLAHRIAGAVGGTGDPAAAMGLNLSGRRSTRPAKWWPPQQEEDDMTHGTPRSGASEADQGQPGSLSL